MLRRTTQLAFGTALVAAAAAFAPTAHADRVGFNVSIGGPGYAVSVGNGPYWGYRPYYRPHYPRHYWRAPYVAPRVVYVPPRVVYRAPYVRYPAIVRGPVYYDYYYPY